LDLLKIGGLTPLTTIDYPDHLSCVIYTQGCSWRCHYCHNPDLLGINTTTNFSWEKLVSFLKKRTNLLEAVVFSGGEPLLQKNLVQAIVQVKELGFKIGLHTAGALPKRFKQVLPLVDWVGFDVKDLSSYVDSITQVKTSGIKNWQSLKLLLKSNITHQCRTTVHWQLIDETRLVKLTHTLKEIGVENYCVQFSRTTNILNSHLGYSVKSNQKMLNLKTKLREIMPKISFTSE
jgi:anaerobic ribonucleoside-triphosphate reductase activating protein